jgi:hypothetical protein
MKTRALYNFVSLALKTMLVFTLMFTSNINAQTTLDSTNLVNEFIVNAKFIQADELGNLYIVSPSNQLYKYNTLGKVLATLNYNYNGNISSIDASNPMEIYVFYKEINRVLFLDNNLAYRGELDLTKQNITQASAIARSYDNGIWVFDMGDLQLKKMSKDGNITQSSGNIRQIIKTDFVPNGCGESTSFIDGHIKRVCTHPRYANVITRFVCQETGTSAASGTIRLIIRTSAWIGCRSRQKC